MHVHAAKLKPAANTFGEIELRAICHYRGKDLSRLTYDGLDLYRGRPNIMASPRHRDYDECRYGKSSSRNKIIMMEWLLSSLNNLGFGFVLHSRHFPNWELWVSLAFVVS